MDISIIIPTKDRGQIFEETLESASKAIVGMDAEIIVINDSRTSKPYISPNIQNVKLIDNPKSGVASARNLGALHAKSDLILFMDDDFLIPKECIIRLVEIALLHPKKIHLFNWVYPSTLYNQLPHLQFGRYLIQNGYTSVQGWLGNEWSEEEVFELKDGASYFLPIRKSLFNEIGGYNENFPHAGAEDYDFVQRAKEKGVRFFLDKSYLLFHNENDRVDLQSWLKRKERNAETIKLAIQLGHKELLHHYGLMKRFIFKVIYHSKTVFFTCLKLIPNASIFDPLYFRLINILLAAHICKGLQNKV